MPMDDVLRNDLAEIYAADDRWRYDHEQWLARRNAAGALPVRETASPGILHRDYSGGALAGTPAPVPAVSNDNPVGHNQVARALGTIHAKLQKALDDETELLHQIVHLEKVERNDEIVKLQTEVGRLRGELGETLKRFDHLHDLSHGLDIVRQEMRSQKHAETIRKQVITERSARVAELQRQNAAARAELERKQFDQALAERDRRIEHLELQLQMLCSFLGAGGYDLPKGL